MTLRDKFNQGVSPGQFFESMNGDQQSLHNAHARRADIDGYREQLKGFDTPVKIMVITEPWCGDSTAIVPVVLKLVEGVESIEIRFLYRDENLDLMDRYLTKGARSIPIFVIMDENYKELAAWGPRPRALQEIFESHREKINSGEIEKMDVMKKIRNYYSKNRGQVIAEEFGELLLNIGR